MSITDKIREALINLGDFPAKDQWLSADKVSREREMLLEIIVTLQRQRDDPTRIARIFYNEAILNIIERSK